MAEEPREPSKLELLETHTDAQLYEVYARLEEAIPSLVGSSDESEIRTIVVNLMRTSYAKALADLRSNPEIIEEMKKIIEAP